MKNTMTRIVTLAAVAIVLAAAAQAGEVLYLVDASSVKGGKSVIYKVAIDPVAVRANLTPIATPLGGGKIPYDRALGLACTPSGRRIYALDTWQGPADTIGTGKIGYLDTVVGTWNEVGYVKDAGGNLVPNIVQAAFSLDGKLFAASDSTNLIYRVNVATGLATTMGQVLDGSGILYFAGADMAFGSDNQSFQWTNGKNGDMPGLYRLSLTSFTPPGTNVNGTFLGNVQGDYFTGIAIRANGYGDIVGSSRTNSTIHVQNRQTGADIATYPMYLNGSPYTYSWGDMTNGPIGSSALCTLSMGYWKNHSWKGQQVTVNGYPVNETLGKLIMNNATSTNFSMLFAQLIAAKLDVNDATGIPVIDSAEAFIVNLNLYVDNDWNKAFSSQTQKNQANTLSYAVDSFIQENECCS